MPQYDYHTVNLTGLTFGTYNLALQSNRNRVGFNITANNPSVASNFTLDMSYTNDTADSAVWWRGDLPVNQSFMYRDFGPIVAEVLYIKVDSVNTKITITETVRIPQMR